MYLSQHKSNELVEDYVLTYKKTRKITKNGKTAQDVIEQIDNDFKNKNNNELGFFLHYTCGKKFIFSKVNQWEGLLEGSFEISNRYLIPTTLGIRFMPKYKNIFAGIGGELCLIARSQTVNEQTSLFPLACSYNPRQTNFGFYINSLYSKFFVTFNFGAEYNINHNWSIQGIIQGNINLNSNNNDDELLILNTDNYTLHILDKFPNFVNAKLIFGRHVVWKGMIRFIFCNHKKKSELVKTVKYY